MIFLCLLLPCAFHLILSMDPAAITLYTTDIISYAHIMIFVIFKLEFQHDNRDIHPDYSAGMLQSGILTM